MIFNGEIPIGWPDALAGLGSTGELDLMCDAIEAGREDEAEAIVERAYERVYARYGAELLELEASRDLKDGDSFEL
ncbi:MAG TPA: hypothetical protein VGC91_07930 [Pyrinomonadaceae bacterium]|jgi:hypothetical protein